MTAPLIVIDDTEVNAAFRRLHDLGSDPREALDAVGRVVKSKAQLGFHNGTDPYGRPWAPLKSRAGQPLRDKGHLMNSFDYRVEGNSVVIGTNLSYARVHQDGATIRPKGGGAKDRLRFLVNGRAVFAKEVTIPPREMLPLSGLPADWSEDIVDALLGAIRRRWNK
jgi:phage gpG-like protein